MKRNKIGIPFCAFWLAAFALNCAAVLATDYYVATDGNDANPGSIATPWATIQYGVDQLSAGDTLYLRAGSYHEAVVMNNVDGTSGSPIVITNYQDEEVIINGTEAISDIAASGWTQHSGNIYKITLSKDVWQLFMGDRMQIIARWPNASTHPADPVVRNDGTWVPEDGSWWSKSTTWAYANKPGTDVNGVIENNPSYHDLAGTGLSFQGGSAILALISQGPGNGERLIETHTAGSNFFTHAELDDSAKSKGYSSSKTFIIEHLNALDQAEEWYYTPADNTLYLWADDGLDPNGRDVRGRTVGHAFDMTDCDYVTIRGMKFFAANFRTDWGKSSTHVRIEDCRLSYPDASQRLLGIYPHNPDDSDYQTCFYGNYNALINCVMEYSEHGTILFSGEGTELHNNLFHHTCMLGIGYTSAILQVNKFTRNTVYICGTRAGVKTNANPQENRIHTHNLFDGFGYQQVQTDGTALQCNSAKSTGTIRAYNWFLKAPKYGSRWDGHTGLQGTNHHQVGFDMRGAMQIKGDEHLTHNNTCLGDSDKNNIIILAETTENLNSVTQNNLADRIAGHRSGTVSSYPIPGTHTNNWNGYITGTDASDQLRDPVNHDFRPTPGADIIDAGTIIPGITDGYLGAAPDIGAYEHNDPNYWIPGRQEEKATFPLPYNGRGPLSLDTDLIWRPGRYAISHDIYLGTDPNALIFQRRQVNNIFKPDYLGGSRTYYWRIDSVTPTEIVTGDIWSFTTVESPGGEPLSFTPTHDTFVNSGQSTNNYGGNGVIRVSSGSRFGYLKFEVTGTGGVVYGAFLKIRAEANPFDDLTAYAVTGNWDEMAITWDTDDLAWGGQLDSIGPISSETWYYLDVNDLVTGDGTYTIGLKTTSSGATNRLYSKDSANDPELLVYTTQTGVPIDINGDGKINFVDLSIIAKFQPGPCSAPDWCAGADLDRNGSINWLDVKALADSWLMIP
jgi:hypothetical protein